MLPRILPFLMLAACGCGTASHRVADPGAELTSRGAKAAVQHSLDEVNSRARSIFRQLDIQVTGSRQLESGKVRELTGRLGNTDVTVTMESAPEAKVTTNLEVEVTTSVAQWDPELALQILSFIFEPG
ncbi:MAG: hypothetical protein HY074_18160 [Deltaproteobacteria bacterium]|nr:hypothetical protein [Deltaproteobacteria bacterium]